MSASTAKQSRPYFSVSSSQPNFINTNNQNLSTYTDQSRYISHSVYSSTQNNRATNNYKPHGSPLRITHSNFKSDAPLYTKSSKGFSTSSASNATQVAVPVFKNQDTDQNVHNNDINRKKLINYATIGCIIVSVIALISSSLVLVFMNNDTSGNNKHVEFESNSISDQQNSSSSTRQINISSAMSHPHQIQTDINSS